MRDLAVDVVAALLDACLEVSADGGEGLVKKGASCSNGLFDAIRIVYLFSLKLRIVSLN